MSSYRVGLNPLPWVLTADGFDLSVPILRTAFAEIATTPFTGIHADPPADLDANGYAALLAEFGLRPAPGYFARHFAADDPGEIVEAAKRHAAVQAALGNTEVFIADHLSELRRAEPAVGTGFDAATLDRVIDRLGQAAEAITAEGVRPALHPHVGSWIEVESEVRAALDGIPASVLGFGPDTGHLSWAGMDAVAVMTDYADRIAAVHLKDVHLDQAHAAREAGADYTQATRVDFTVWTEPGRGDVQLEKAIGALPDAFAGWLIVEVDVPEAPTNLESTQISGRWVAEHLGADTFSRGRA
ncbi:sugar phosphate isomerase/epimerase family protein [Microlunatus antarcticus]|uniref:Inosose dehydratase n=1 Tax=Microlunatus antarcticus TaxID=53388 RepID=A0A7W5JU94_9ACTN|nr:sugar phosphate isomerase/epimerase [Microlunatus antarcticus]MBB3326414.1 inosose dehydratase [Microlunatus antarcticus]